VLALLPAASVAAFKPGTPVALRFSGRPDQLQTLSVERVGSAIVDAEAALRQAGGRPAAAAPLSGPVVIVHSSVPPAASASPLDARGYYDGLQGEAEVTIGSVPAIVDLVPGLRSLWRRP
jgi:hypothetical protein